MSQKLILDISSSHLKTPRSPKLTHLETSRSPKFAHLETSRSPKLAHLKKCPTTLSEIFPDSKKKLEIPRLPGQIIGPSEDPYEIEWALLPIYKYDQKKKERYWQIGFNPETSELITIYGSVGGKIPIPDRRLVEPKGGRTILQQALQEARSRYRCKWRDDGYRPRGENIKSRLEYQAALHYNPPNFPRRHSTEVSSKNINFPVGVMPKLDGGRVRVWLTRDREGDDLVEILTRNNVPYVYFKPHKENLAQFLSYLSPGDGLDGEWYNHEMDFSILNGICRRTKNYNSRENELKMYIFDIITPGKTVEERYSMLIRAFHNFLEDGYQNTYFEILNITWAYNHDELIDFHNQYVDLGYEGLMIRHLASSNPKNPEISHYKGGRNKNWLKFKSFEEEEGIVVDVTEGKGRERGVALFVVQDKNGRTFQVRPMGRFEWRKECLQHPEKYIGRVYTYQFYEKTEYGFPRFPRGKAFRDKKSNKGKMVV